MLSRCCKHCYGATRIPGQTRCLQTLHLECYACAGRAALQGVNLCDLHGVGSSKNALCIPGNLPPSTRTTLTVLELFISADVHGHHPKGPVSSTCNQDLLI